MSSGGGDSNWHGVLILIWLATGVIPTWTEVAPKAFLLFPGKGDQLT